MKLEDWNIKPCSCERIEGFDVSLSTTFNGRVVVRISRESPYYGELNIGSVAIEVVSEVLYDKELIKNFFEETVDNFPNY
jgi:hypothetical protein